MYRRMTPVEFNHCVKLERASRRPRFLVERVLSDYGHLSNRQAAEAVRALAEADEPGGLTAVVQLHLSRDCNTPELAAEAGRAGTHAAAVQAYSKAIMSMMAGIRTQKRKKPSDSDVVL